MSNIYQTSNNKTAMKAKSDFQKIITDCLIIDGKIYAIKEVNPDHPCKVCELKLTCQHGFLKICNLFVGSKGSDSMALVGTVDFGHLDETETPTPQNANFHIF